MSYTLSVSPLATKEFNDAARWYDEQQNGLATQKKPGDYLTEPSLYNKAS